MTKLSEQIGYIRGIIGSMELAPDSPNAKLLTALADVLEGFSGEIGDLRDDLTELNDFVESLDEDLEDLEATIDGDERGEVFPGEDEEYDEDDEEYDEDSRYPESALRVLSSRAKSSGSGDSVGQPLAASICSACGKVFFVPLSEIKEENELYACPHCQKPVIFTPIGPDNAPIAKPYRE